MELHSTSDFLGNGTRRSRSNILFIRDWVCLFVRYAPLEWWWYKWTPCSLSMRKRCPKWVVSCCFLIFLLHFHLALLVAAAPSIHHALLHMLGLTLTSTPLPSMHTGALQYILHSCMWVCSFSPDIHVCSPCLPRVKHYGEGSYPKLL